VITDVAGYIVKPKIARKHSEKRKMKQPTENQNNPKNEI